MQEVDKRPHGDRQLTAHVLEINQISQPNMTIDSHTQMILIDAYNVYFTISYETLFRVSF